MRFVSRRGCAGLAYVLAAASAPSAAFAAPPAEVVDAVTRELLEAGADRAEIEGNPDLFVATGLSGQQAPDWIANFDQVPSGMLCGTGGCPLQVWVKRADGVYRLAFHLQVLDWGVGDDGAGRHWLTTELHGVHCGGTGSDECHYVFEWRGRTDDSTGRFEATSIGGEPAQYVGPLVQANGAGAGATPPLAAVAREFAEACGARGGVPDTDAGPTLLPDLNGDGWPEALFDAGYAFCNDAQGDPVSPCGEADCPSRLYDSTGTGVWREVWSGPPFEYRIEFRDGKAALVRE